MQNQVVFSKAESVRDVLRYLKRFKNASIVIYIDDRIINSSLFTSHIRDISMIHEAGLKVIIVPGARTRIDEVIIQAGISWKIIDGCRITKEEAMPLIKMAAFDSCNQIMTSLAGEKKTAVIGNWVRARSRGVLDGVDFATSGEIEKIQIESIQKIMENGFIPIFPCIGWSTAGKPYNISSVSLASYVAQQIKADKLLFLVPDAKISCNQFNVPSCIGFSEEGKVPALSIEEAKLFVKSNLAESLAYDNQMLEEEKKARILDLVKVGINACSNGVSRIHILDSYLDGTIPCEIFSDFGSGTMIYESNYGGIRNMATDDIPAIMNLIRPFVEEGILLPRTEQNLAANYGDYVVYELDGGIRACAALHLYDKVQGEIAAVAVEPAYSHIGVGIKLVKYLLDRAKMFKLNSVFIMTTQAGDWFESIGFVPDKIDSLPQERLAKWTSSRNSRVYRIQL